MTQRPMSMLTPPRSRRSTGGTLALWQKWLERAIALRPDGADAKAMLAEAFYRRDDFQKAAASLKGVEVSSNKLVVSQYPTLNVAKLESFKGQTLYEV